MSSFVLFVRAQLSVVLTILNGVYKVGVIWSAITLHMAFTQREALIDQIELDAGISGSQTSSGEAQDPRSLSAMEGR